MTDHYGIIRHEHRIDVESNNSLLIVTRLRLFVDGFHADERSVFWGDTRLHGEIRDEGDAAHPVTVEVSIGFFGGVARCVLIEDDAEYLLVEE